MSDRRLRIAIAVLALAGLGVAGYLTWVHYGDLEPFCAGGSGGCEKVQSSDYAELAGIPVALLGLIGYGAILASLMLPGDLGRFAGAVLALAGFGFSAWLTYVELFEIDAICQWCVASAVIMTALAVVTSLRFASSGAPDPLDR
jgi:uncharacterized membrane protein